MKKHLLCFVVTLLFVPQIVLAFDFVYNNVTYEFNDDNVTVSVSNNSGISGAVIIPSTVEYNSQTYSVTAIRNNAFAGSKLLTSIEMPNSIISIGLGAFGSCTGLTSVEIPNSVTSIDSGIFLNCTNLTSIVVDKNNKVYDSRDNCNAIIETASNTLVAGCRETKIPGNITSIWKYSFYGCSGLTSLNIPYGVISIGQRAFYECTGLTSVQIPSSVTTIEMESFCGCTGLASLEIPSSVISIGQSAFVPSVGITSITVDKDNKVYDSRDNCNAIIETVTNTLILGCKETKIPNSITSIGNSAFRCCTDITSIEIPGSVTYIGEDAFLGCEALSSIICYASEPPELDVDAFSFVNRSVTVYVPCSAINIYDRRARWSRFSNKKCIEAKHIDEPLDDVVITPSNTKVVVAWPVVDNAESYVIEIKTDGKTFCVVTFNNKGQLLSIEYSSASERMAEARDASAAYGYQFSIASLTPETEYSYTITALDASERTLSLKSGSFTTTSEPVLADEQNAEPEFKDKVYVQDKNIMVEGLSSDDYSIYNTTGKQVSNPVPASGVYVVKVGDEAVKVMVK